MGKNGTQVSNKPPATKAALYIRVSTEAQREEGYSIDAQKEMLQAHCVSRGVKSFEFYIDGGYTGSNIDRPELQRLIRDAKDGAIDGVIVYKLDRLSRSQKDTLYLIEDVFNPHNVSFTSIQESMDTATPLGRLMLGILSAFAQLERENIRERTRMGMTERVKSGLWMGGGRVPYGYDYDRKQGILVPNKDAETVRRIYDLYLKGYSLNRISQMVGLKYERLAYQILNRKSNCGFICYNGEEYRGKHEPIVSLETYMQAQEMLHDRSVKNLSTSEYLLTGLIFCGKCGAKMRYQKWGKNGCKVVCYSQDKSKPHLSKDPNCDNAKVWADDVEDHVVKDIFKFCLAKREEGIVSPAMSVLEILHDQYNTLATKVKRLYSVYASDGNPILLETIQEHQRDLEKISRQIASETERSTMSNRIVEIKREIENLEEIWDTLMPKEKQTIIRTIVDSVTISEYDLRISYSF